LNQKSALAQRKAAKGGGEDASPKSGMPSPAY